jgi:hypothetical protein
MVLPWRLTSGVEPDAVKAARPVLNGGDEETCGNATRLVPTQPGFRARLSASVRCARYGSGRPRRGAPAGAPPRDPQVPAVAQAVCLRRRRAPASSLPARGQGGAGVAHRLPGTRHTGARAPNNALEPTAPMAVVWPVGAVQGAAAHRERSATFQLLVERK